MSCVDAESPPKGGVRWWNVPSWQWNTRLGGGGGPVFLMGDGTICCGGSCPFWLTMLGVPFVGELAFEGFLLNNGISTIHKTCAISFSPFVGQTFPLARDKIFGSRLFALFTCFAAFCYAVLTFHFEFSFLIYSSHDKWTLKTLTIADRLRVWPSLGNLVHSRKTRSKRFTSAAHQLKPGSVSLPGD